MFRNIVSVTKSRVKVVADVAWTPPADEAEPNRLGSSITRAGVQIALGRRGGLKPLRIPLPLKVIEPGEVQLLFC